MRVHPVLKGRHRLHLCLEMLKAREIDGSWRKPRLQKRLQPVPGGNPKWGVSY